MALAVPALAASPELENAAGPAGFVFAGNVDQGTNHRTWSATVNDYNGDDLQDVLIIFHQRENGRLYRNNGDGTFTRVATTAWPRVNSQGGQFDRHECAWADVDRNGLLDSYCSGGRNDSNVYKTANRDNELWMQLAPGQFTDMGTEMGVGDPCGRGRYTAFLDVNADGWQDIFLGNQAGRTVADPQCDPTPHLEQSKIYLNRGMNGSTFLGFAFAPEWNVNRSSTGQTCAVPWDYDRDGDVDLLACNFYNRTPQLFRNTGSGFVEVASSLGLGAMSDAATGDLNGDQILDLAYSDGSGYAYRLGTGSAGNGRLGPVVRLQQVPSGVDGSGIAVGDINGDGRLDVYGLADYTSAAGNPDDSVFINQGPPSFLRLTPPSATGKGDAVAALTVVGEYDPDDPDEVPQSEFLVLNGKLANAGPLQLISYNPPDQAQAPMGTDLLRPSDQIAGTPAVESQTTVTTTLATQDMVIVESSGSEETARDVP